MRITKSGAEGEEKLFLLRTVEWLGNSRVLSHSGYVHGLGKFELKWKRVADVDKTLLKYDDDESLRCVEYAEGLNGFLNSTRRCETKTR